MQRVFEIEANYTLVKVPQDILASIYCELKGLSIVENFRLIDDKIKNGCQEIIQFLTKELANYTGNFSDCITIEKQHNIIPQVFRNELAKQIAGVANTTSFEANYVAVGLSSATPLAADTTLGNEHARGPFTKREATDNTAYLDKFFSSSEVWGQQLREVGVFVDWTATAGSGVLLSKVNVSEDMSTNETLTLNITITVNSAT